MNVGIGHMPAFANHLGGESHGRVGLRVERATVAVGRDLGFAEFRQVLAHVAVRRQAVAAVVDLRDGQRDALACLRWQAALGQRAGHVQVALQRGRAVGDQTEQVRHAADLLAYGFEKRAGRCRCGGDAGGGGETGHGVDSEG
jgi:hypothetical protein